MKESDWKTFKRIKSTAIERFCGQALAEFETIIAASDEPAHSRYLRVYELVNSRDREMARIFDAHSRSEAPMQLAAIRAKGLADEVLLGELSAEFLAQTDPAPHFGA